MKTIVKYEVKYKKFTDKNTNKEVKIGDIIDVDVERMKVLNAHDVGRAIDFIVEDEPSSSSAEPEGKNQVKNTDTDNNGKEKYTKEQLEELSVNNLKELAEKMQIELTKAKKDEIIEEILQNQK